jgi:hypothetical protein
MGTLCPRLSRLGRTLLHGYEMLGHSDRLAQTDQASIYVVLISDNAWPA